MVLSVTKKKRKGESFRKNTKHKFQNPNKFQFAKHKICVFDHRVLFAICELCSVIFKNLCLLESQK